MGHVWFPTLQVAYSISVYPPVVRTVMYNCTHDSCIPPRVSFEEKGAACKGPWQHMEKHFISGLKITYQCLQHVCACVFFLGSAQVVEERQFALGFERGNYFHSKPFRWPSFSIPLPPAFRLSKSLPNGTWRPWHALFAWSSASFNSSVISSEASL